MSQSTTAAPMMGPWLTTGLVVGTMIGSGIFMLPVSLAPLGINAVIAWVVSIAGAMSIAFALARLSSRGGEGGIQSFIEQDFGALVGFVITWAFWISCWVSNAAVAIAFGAATSRISPLFGDGTVIILSIAAIAFLTFVNALGVRVSGGLNLLTIAIKLLPLLGVVVLLILSQSAGAPLEPLAEVPLTIGGIATATSLTLFAMLGFENATAPVGKVRDPARTLPRAILGGTALVGLVYLLSSSAVLLLLPAEVVANSPAPYADVFAARGGEGLVLLAAFAIAVSAFGSLNCGILVSGELALAMAQRRQLPAVMSRTVRGNVPVAAQLASSVLSILLVLANSSRSTADLFAFTILLTTSAILFVYLVGTVAAWRHCPSAPAQAMLVLAVAFIAFAFWGAGFEANAWSVALLVLGLPVFALMRRLNSLAAIPPAVGPAAPPESSA
jgi:APA family basic amino acid/polyamine antiporter